VLKCCCTRSGECPRCPKWRAELSREGNVRSAINVCFRTVLPLVRDVWGVPWTCLAAREEEASKATSLQTTFFRYSTYWRHHLAWKFLNSAREIVHVSWKQRILHFKQIKSRTVAVSKKHMKGKNTMHKMPNNIIINMTKPITIQMKATCCEIQRDMAAALVAPKFSNYHSTFIWFIKEVALNVISIYHHQDIMNHWRPSSGSVVFIAFLYI